MALVGKTSDVAVHLLDWGGCYSQGLGPVAPHCSALLRIATHLVSLLMPTGESVGRLMREGRRDAAFFRLHPIGFESQNTHFDSK